MTGPVLTTTTCNEQCWFAREEVCSCSCGGANHGCLRVEGAEQPVRNSRVKDHRYLLQAVGLYSEISKARYAAAAPDYAAARGLPYRMRLDRGEPAIVKRATPDQVARWPELADAKAAGRRPYLLWVREDIAAGS